MIKMNIGALHLPKGLNMLRKIVREPLFAVRSRLAPQISNSGVNVTMLAGRIEKLRITYKKSLEAPRNVNKLKNSRSRPMILATFLLKRGLTAISILCLNPVSVLIKKPSNF